MTIKLPNGRCEECGELYYGSRDFGCRIRLYFRDFSVKNVFRSAGKIFAEYSVWSFATAIVLFLHAPIILGVPVGFALDQGFATPSFQYLSESGHDEDNRTVYIDEKGFAKFKHYYEPYEEQGFCLFGNVSDSRIYVQDVDYVENPLMQKQDEIRFVCRNELLNRSEKLLTDESYKLVGGVHTHPVTSGDCRLFSDSACLSKPDALATGSTSYFAPLMGVYDGSKLRFFTQHSLSRPLDREIYNVRSR